MKATRFGYAVKAQHGTRLLTFDEQRTAYSETVVDLAQERFEFMNTLFELSRASLWTGLVEQHDQHRLPGIHGYAELYRAIDEALGRAHVEGELKAEIVADPDRFVVPDPDLVPTLVDQRLAGKQLLLVTNSDWDYTSKIMGYAVEPHCPPGMGWRDLFDIVIVSADKPRFFADEKQIYRVEDEERSLLKPHYGPLESGHVYFGGNARMVERSLELNAAQVLYVGDHLFGDVHVTKDTLRWRTALIARELEAEIADAVAFADDQAQLTKLMAEKTEVDRELARLRMERRRVRKHGGPGPRESEVTAATDRSQELDSRIAPLARRSGELGNPTWGPLMRGGNDKSLFARQVERYADVYTSRVSNLRAETPYAYLRAARGSLPHDQA